MRLAGGNAAALLLALALVLALAEAAWLLRELEGWIAAVVVLAAAAARTGLARAVPPRALPFIGYAIGRWWAVGLPSVLILLAVPAGYPPGDDWEPLPIWWALTYAAPVAAVLMVPGIGVRKVREARGEEDR